MNHKEKILNVLRDNPSLSKSKISKLSKIHYYKIELLLNELIKQEFVKEEKGYYHLK